MNSERLLSVSAAILAAVSKVTGNARVCRRAALQLECMGVVVRAALTSITSIAVMPH